VSQSTFVSPAALTQGAGPHGAVATSAVAHPFDAFGLHDALLRAVSEAGYVEPRLIQAQTIPAVLEGRDVLGLAQTGTGKTAAFALPILHRLIQKPSRGPSVLVVAPTRELAMQIDADFHKLGKHTRVRTTTIFGGVPDRRQIEDLRRNPDVIIACPGRLLDLHRQNAVNLSRIETLVLDEADHMFDMGFLPDLRRILAALPERRQNLFFSATMPAEIRQLADQILADPIVVELANSSPASTIEHVLYPVPEKNKLELLEYLLEESGFVSAIVFTRTKHRARRLARDLDKTGHKTCALQGNMSQAQRDRAMKGFRAGTFDVLVATDIVARGIDVLHVSHVINFDVPSTPDAYTHRIGRTGRAEQEGRAFTFVTPEDRIMVRAIERRIGSKIPRVVMRGYEAAAAALETRDDRRGGTGFESPRSGGARGRGAPTRSSSYPGAPSRSRGAERRTPSADAEDRSSRSGRDDDGGLYRPTSRGPSSRGSGSRGAGSGGAGRDSSSPRGRAESKSGARDASSTPRAARSQRAEPSPSERRSDGANGSADVGQPDRHSHDAHRPSRTGASQTGEPSRSRSASRDGQGGAANGRRESRAPGREQRGGRESSSSQSSFGERRRPRRPRQR
jgi:ATP-dependent RNA helicase RhlE